MFTANWRSTWLHVHVFYVSRVITARHYQLSQIKLTLSLWSSLSCFRISLSRLTSLRCSDLISASSMEFLFSAISKPGQCVPSQPCPQPNCFLFTCNWRYFLHWLGLELLNQISVSFTWRGAKPVIKGVFIARLRVLRKGFSSVMKCDNPSWRI